jgi:hypothetical protein
MARWSEFAVSEPDFGVRVRQLFDAHRHHTMATVRRDGSPRMSGTEVSFEDGELSLAMMPGAVRELDLRRDPRMALHSATVDPPEEDPSSWAGDAKISGLGIEVKNPEPADGSSRFRLDIVEVVLTKVGTPADHLVIESWAPDRGLLRRERR